MLSFHDDEELKAFLISGLKARANSQVFTQGLYFEDGKGCSLNCSLFDFKEEANHCRTYERVFGIPRDLVMVVDDIFEGLSAKYSKCWPLYFSNAVPVGKDLSMVLPRFFVWVLEGVIKLAKEEGKKVIKGVIDLYKRTIDGENIDVNEWSEARSAAHIYINARPSGSIGADSCAVGAALHAAYASDRYGAIAAAHACESAVNAHRWQKYARKKQALKLIQILEEV